MTRARKSRRPRDLPLGALSALELERRQAELRARFVRVMGLLDEKRAAAQARRADGARSHFGV